MMEVAMEKHDGHGNSIEVVYSKKENRVYITFESANGEGRRVRLAPIGAVDLAKMIITTIGPIKFIKTMIRGR